MSLPKRATALTAAAAATVLLASTGGAVAGSLITSAQIKDNTIQSRDVKNGSLNIGDLSVAARKAIARARTGPAGPAGPAGETGPAGPRGPAGATGGNGIDGAVRSVIWVTDGCEIGPASPGITVEPSPGGCLVEFTAASGGVAVPVPGSGGTIEIPNLEPDGSGWVEISNQTGSFFTSMIIGSGEFDLTSQRKTADFAGDR